MRFHLTRRDLVSTGGLGAISTVAGCSALGGDSTDDDNGQANEDETDERDPDLRIGDRYLSSAHPIEFVEPDFDDTTGFARDTSEGREARIVYVHWHGADVSHWHQSPLELAAGETRVGRTRFLLEGAEEIPLGPDETFSQTVRPAEGTPEGLLRTTVDADRVEITAGEGEGELVFELRADGERRWISPPLPVEIV